MLQSRTSSASLFDSSQTCPSFEINMHHSSSTTSATTSAEQEQGKQQRKYDHENEVERIVMQDLSTNQDYIAYVRKRNIENQKDPNYILTVRTLPEVYPDTTYVYHTLDITRIYYEPYSHVYSAYTIAISDDGKWVCISNINPVDDIIYHTVYKIDHENGIEQVRLREEINRLPGYGVFFQDGHFAIINTEWIYEFSPEFVLLERFYLKPEFQTCIAHSIPFNRFLSGTQTDAIYLQRRSGERLQDKAIEVIGIYLALPDIKQRLIHVSKYGHFWKTRKIRSDNSSSRATPCISKDLIVLSESNEIIITNNTANSVEYRLPFDSHQNLMTVCNWKITSCQRYLVMLCSPVEVQTESNVHLASIKVWSFLSGKYVYSWNVGTYDNLPSKSLIALPCRESKVGDNIELVADVYYQIWDRNMERYKRKCHSIVLKRDKVLCKSVLNRRYDEEQSYEEYDMQKFGLNQWAALRENDDQSQEGLCYRIVIYNYAAFYIDFLPYGLNCRLLVSAQNVCMVHYTPEWDEMSIQHCQNVTEKERHMAQTIRQKLLCIMGFPCCHYPQTFVDRRKPSDIDELVQLLYDDSAKMLTLKFECNETKREHEFPFDLERFREQYKALDTLCNKTSDEKIRAALSTRYFKEVHCDSTIPLVKIKDNKPNCLTNMRSLFDSNALFTVSQNEYMLEVTCRAVADIKKGDYTRFYKTVAIPESIVPYLDSMDRMKSQYFQTVRGTWTLEGLATCSIGKQILFEIIKRQNVKIGFVSDTVAVVVNPLERLILDGNFELYKMLLNRLLLDSDDIMGRPITRFITDAVVELQNQCREDILVETMNSFDYVPAGKSLLRPSESSLFFYGLHAYDSDQLVPTNNVFRKVFADEEKEIKSFEESFGFWYRIKSRSAKLSRKKRNSYDSQKRTDFYRRHGLRLCVIPLTRLFNFKDNGEVLHQALLSYGCKSQLSFGTATKETKGLTDDGYSLVSALILHYKWKTYIRFRFCLVFLLHLFFYLTYFLSVAFAQEVFGYLPGSSSITDSVGHVVFVTLFFFIAAVLFVQETRQMRKSLRKYISSFYNFIDLLMLLLTIANFIQMVYASAYVTEVCSVCALIIWLHCLLRLRVVYTIGHALEIIIQLFNTVSQIIMLMIVVVAAFSHAFIILLRNKDDSYFQEQYTGTIVSSASTEANVTLSDNASNDFNDVFKAFKDVWFFIYGIWDPITGGDSADNVMAILMAIAFSFIVLLTFFNIVIGFMSASIEKMRQQGKRAWLIHYSNVIMEIEQYWCYKSDNRYPSYMYYIARSTEIESQQKRLRKEIDYLIHRYDGKSSESLTFAEKFRNTRMLWLD